MKSLTLSVLLLAAAMMVAAQDPALPSQQPQQPQTFRSAVDLVPVDVNVIDRNGRPIGDLTVQDFSLKVDGKTRRIASAQFIAVTRGIERAPKMDAFPGKPVDHLYVVDPFGNLMMRYPRDADPSRMLKDLQRLLRVAKGA